MNVDSKWGKECVWMERKSKEGKGEKSVGEIERCGMKKVSGVKICLDNVKTLV